MRPIRGLFPSAVIACLTLLSIGAATARADDRFDLDETYDMSADGTIRLTTHDAEVTIVGADRDDARVEIHYRREVSGVGFGGDEYAVDVEAEAGDLVIRERPRSRSEVAVGVVRTRYEVRVEAPHGVSLEIQGDDDDYDISGIHGAIALAADDGSIRLGDCRGAEFDIAFEDGELSMDRGAGALRLEFDDGKADIREATFRTVHARGNDGSLRLRGNLAQDGEYTFLLDDGSLDLQVGEGAGRFTVELADGTLDLEGGSGSMDLRYDDGEARLRRAAFQVLRVRASDGDFLLEGPVPTDGDYRIELDDGRVELEPHGGGGRISVRFDDGGVEVGGGVRPIAEAEHRASYEWGEGNADVAIEVQDGAVKLSAR